jgi:hypothetical protein
VSETYTAVYERDGTTWTAKIAEQPGLEVSADSVPQARDRIRDALASRLNTEVAQLKVKDTFLFSARVRATQEEVRATRTEAERSEMLASLTEPKDAKEWAEDLGLADRNPAAVEWLSSLEGRQIGIDEMCHVITLVEQQAMYASQDGVNIADSVSEESAQK